MTSLVFFPFKKKLCSPSGGIASELPGKVCGEEEGGQAGDERSWRHLSDGTPYLTTGPMEFVEMVGSFLLSELV